MVLRTFANTFNQDWRSTRESAAETIRQIAEQPLFVPRVGELVLWCHTIKGEIRRHPHSKEFRLFDPVSGRWGKHPRWIGGVISQAPSPDEPISQDDILNEGKRKKAVTYSGFRVECLPNPNDRDKSLSLRYSHVPMHHIRPLTYWKEFMLGIPPGDWHPTIRNCMTTMGTIAQIERYQFHGIWPDANIHSKGCAYGAETFYIGDVVRMHFDDTTVVTDILHITDIVFKFKGYHPDHNERVLPHLVSTINADFHGYGYTTDIKRSSFRVQVNPTLHNHGLPKMVYDYGPWFYIFQPNEVMTTSCTTILGRLFEGDAIRKWLPDTDEGDAVKSRFSDTNNDSPLMQAGFQGLLEMRKSALEWDERMKNPSKPYRLCERRVDALDILTFNGRDVSRFEDEYIPFLWRRVMAEVDKVPWKSKTEPPVPHEYRAISYGQAGDEDETEKSVLRRVVRGVILG